MKSLFKTGKFYLLHGRKWYISVAFKCARVLGSLWIYALILSNFYFLKCIQNGLPNCSQRWHQFPVRRIQPPRGDLSFGLTLILDILWMWMSGTESRNQFGKNWNLLSVCIPAFSIYLTFLKIPCSNSLLMYRNAICFCVLTVYNNKLGIFLNAQVEGISRGQEVATKTVIWTVCNAKREKVNWSQENIELRILTIQKWSLGQNKHLQNQGIGRLVNKT